MEIIVVKATGRIRWKHGASDDKAYAAVITNKLIFVLYIYIHKVINKRNSIKLRTGAYVCPVWTIYFGLGALEQLCDISLV